MKRRERKRQLELGFHMAQDTSDGNERKRQGRCGKNGQNRNQRNEEGQNKGGRNKYAVTGI